MQHPYTAQFNTVSRDELGLYLERLARSIPLGILLNKGALPFVINFEGGENVAKTYGWDKFVEVLLSHMHVPTEILKNQNNHRGQELCEGFHAESGAPLRLLLKNCYSQLKVPRDDPLIIHPADESSEFPNYRRYGDIYVLSNYDRYLSSPLSNKGSVIDMPVDLQVDMRTIGDIENWWRHINTETLSERSRNSTEICHALMP